MPGTPRFAALPPPTADYAQWAAYVGRLHARWTGYSVRILGWGQGIAAQRVETAECLDRERQAGRIR